MIRLVCPKCQKALSMGIWDSRSQQVYCSDCLPSLPGNNRSPASTRLRPETSLKRYVSRNIGEGGRSDGRC